MRKGNVWLRGVLTDVAWAVARTKDNYLSTQYQRLAQRRGANEQRWRRHTRSYELSTTCYATARHTKTWAATISTNWIKLVFSNITSTALNSLAIQSRLR